MEDGRDEGSFLGDGRLGFYDRRQRHGLVRGQAPLGRRLDQAVVEHLEEALGHALQNRLGVRILAERVGVREQIALQAIGRDTEGGREVRVGRQLAVALGGPQAGFLEAVGDAIHRPALGDGDQLEALGAAHQSLEDLPGTSSTLEIVDPAAHLAVDAAPARQGQEHLGLHQDALLLQALRDLGQRLPVADPHGQRRIELRPPLLEAIPHGQERSRQSQKRDDEEGSQDAWLHRRGAILASAGPRGDPGGRSRVGPRS